MLEINGKYGGITKINNKESYTDPLGILKYFFNPIMSSLRLLKSGDIKYNHIIFELLMWNGNREGPMLIDMGNSQYYFNKYKLEKNEIEELKNLFQKVKNAPEFLRIPISRFNFAYDRRKPEDKLIDLIVALESLLVKENQELSYRLSLRTSFLLGKNNKERKELFCLMKKAYNLRSKIVHGSKYKNEVKINNKTIPIYKLVSNIEDILRKSIKKALNFKDSESFLESIDNYIFGEENTN